MRVDVFADGDDQDDAPLLVSARVDDGVASLRPGETVVARVAATCRAPFVVPPELALRFESSGGRYAHARRRRNLRPGETTPVSADFRSVARAGGQSYALEARSPNVRLAQYESSP